MIGAAQLGPIQRNDSRQLVVRRLIELLRKAHARGCELVVYPEMALTTFFPRWYMTDQAEIDAFFEREMPNAATRPLFEEARHLGIGFYLGYAELVEEGGRVRRFNTAILVGRDGKLIGKVQIARVDKTQCVANLMPGWTHEEVREGDEVLY